MMAKKEEVKQNGMKELEKNCPYSTESERHRFLESCGGDAKRATKRLQRYLDWRATHDVETLIRPSNGTAERDDKTDWEYSVHAALETVDIDGTYKRRRRKQQNGQTAAVGSSGIPQFIMLHQHNETGTPITERDGRLLFHVLPAQIDKKLSSTGIYELVVALYLECKFERDSLRQGTLLVDVRPGHGFPNVPALMLMPFIQTCTKYLHRLFPERLYRCILYPLPRPALWLWDIARALIDDAVVERIKLIAGSESMDAPPPNEDLAEYVDESILEQCECARLASFVRS